MDVKKLAKIADTICDYSINVTKGDNVFILAWIGSQPLVQEICKAVNARGGNPFVVLSDDNVDATILKDNPDAYQMQWDMYTSMMEKMDKMVNIRALDEEALKYAGANGAKKVGIMRPAYTTITTTKPWVLLTYPTPAIAKMFGKSLAEMEDFWLEATSYDYSKMSEAAKPLVELMSKSNDVHIVAPGTDLKFSIAGLDGIPCIGERNIPDGEVYTSPVKDSVEGYITYNQVTPNGGTMFHDVRFDFEKGKIVKATCNGSEEDNKKLNDILNVDEGSRYIGEFALSFNNMVTETVGNILFDEKMIGAMHFTPGSSYKNSSYNGNDSKTHWDIITCHLAKFGGGEIYFDGKLIRKDGIFTLPELQGLNPDQAALDKVKGR